MARIKTHPGTVLRRHYIETGATTVTRLAESCGVSSSTLSRILNQKSAVTPELAVRLEVALGKSAQFWLNLQTAHDLSLAYNSVKSLKTAKPHKLKCQRTAFPTSK